MIENSSEITSRLVDQERCREGEIENPSRRTLRKGDGKDIENGRSSRGDKEEYPDGYL